MKKTALALALLTASSVALAQSGNTFDYIDVVYASIDVNADPGELGNAELRGAGIEGSFLINDNVFVQAGYFDTSETVRFGADFSKISFNEAKVSVGYRYGLDNNVDVYGQVGVSRQDLATRLVIEDFDVSTSEPENGYLLELGAKYSLNKFEGGVFIEYSDVGDYGSDTFFGLEGRFKVTQQFHIVGSYSKTSDVDYLRAGVSYSF